MEARRTASHEPHRVKYLVTVQGQRRQVEVEPGSSPSGFLVTIDGQRREVDLARTARAWLSSLIVDGRSFQVSRSEGAVEIEGQTYTVEIERDVGLGSSVATLAAGGGPTGLKAPIPGLVVAVRTALGDEVQDGQALIIVEAMKMQMELKAPRAGHILQIEVTPGQEVRQGQTLAVIGE